MTCLFRERSLSHYPSECGCDENPPTFFSVKAQYDMAQLDVRLAADQVAITSIHKALFVDVNSRCSSCSIVDASK